MVKHDHEIEEHYFIRLENSYRFYCKERNEAESCHKLADFMERIKKKPHLAYDVYKENCFKRDFGDSCFKYGSMTFNETHKIKRPEKVEESLRAHVHGCEVKKYNGSSCHIVGTQHFVKHFHPVLENVLHKQNPKKGVELYKKACEGDDNIACLDLATIYKDGLSKANVKPDPELMFKYAEKTCDLKHVEGCKLLAYAYKNGIGTQKNEEMYKKYVDMCDLMTGKKAQQLRKK